MAVHGRLRALLVLAALGVALLIAACGGDDGEGDGAVRTSDEDSEQCDLLPIAWGYGGDRGPAIWGSLDPAYEACSQGERQSPIDLVEVETTAPSAIAFAYVPEEVEGEAVRVPGEVNALDLLPPDPETTPRWSYQGSLTTSPWSEVVTWCVFAEPIELSTGQIARFTSIFESSNPPVQPLNERELLFGG